MDFQDGLNPHRGFAGTRIFAHTRLFAGTRFSDRGSVFVYRTHIKPDPDEDHSTSCLFFKSRICFCTQNPYYKTSSPRTSLKLAESVSNQWNKLSTSSYSKVPGTGYDFWLAPLQANRHFLCPCVDPGLF